MQQFSRYLTYKRDNNDLLFFMLKQLVQEHVSFYRNRKGKEQELVEIPEQDLVDRVH